VLFALPNSGSIQPSQKLKPMNKTALYGFFFALLWLMTGCGLKTASAPSNNHLSNLEIAQDNSQASALDKQADTLFLSGYYTQSADLYQQALTLREGSNGKDDLTVVQSLYNLATAHEAKGEYVSAIKLYRRAQSIAEKNSSNHAKTIQGFIAVLFEARGMIGQTKNSTLQSVSAYKNFTKGKHPFYGIVLYKLAGFYSQEKKIEQADKYFQESIAAIEQNNGEQHPYLAVVLEDYARLSRSNNLEIDSTILEQRATRIREYYPKKQRCEIYRKRMVKVGNSL
jgi:tetratricopeptide (TPR) repeat protein